MFGGQQTNLNTIPQNTTNQITKVLQNEQNKAEIKQVTLSKEAQIKERIFQSQKNIGDFLAQIINSRDDKSLFEHKDRLKNKLKNALMYYEVSKPMNQLELEHLIDQHQKANKLQWSAWMMERTKLLVSSSQSGQLKRSPQVSQKMIDFLLQPLCEQISLEPVQVLELLQSYFCEYPNKYQFLTSLDEKINSIETQMSQILQTTPFQQDLNQNLAFANMQQNQQQFVTTFKQSVEETRQLVLRFYIAERSYLINNLTAIFNASAFDPTKELAALRQELLGNGHMIKYLIKSLLRNLKWSRHEFKMLKDEQQKIVLEALQLEQIKILQIVFCLSQEQDIENGRLEVNMSHLKKLMKYLIKTDFRGYMVFGIDFETSRQISLMQNNSETQVINESKIRDLGILTFLAMLRIDVFAACPQGTNKEKTNLMNGLFKQQSKDLNKLKKYMSEVEPNALSSIILIALHVILSSVDSSSQHFTQDQELALIQQHFMVEIRNIFQQSFLLSTRNSDQGRVDDASTRSIQGEYLKVLKSFLNLIYNPVLVKHDMLAEQEEVQSITIHVLLKNAAILKDVWSALDKKKRQQIGQQVQIENEQVIVLRMFEDLLQSPMESLPFYSFLLKQLTGKNRYSYARFVFKMMDIQKVKADVGVGQGNILSAEEFKKNKNIASTSLLHEMLAGFLILLNQLHLQLLAEQEKFDTLANFIVIFSKIIKQAPLLYSALNNSLLDLIKSRRVQRQAFVIEEKISGSNLDSAIQNLLFGYEEALQDRVLDNPMLILLVRSLFTLTSKLDPSLTCGTAKHNMDAITKVFNLQPELRKSVIDLIMVMQSEQFSLNSYFYRVTMEYEANKQSFLCSISYLKFIGKIFKLEYPQLILNQAQQISLHQSFLEEMLRVNYCELMTNFFQFRFQSVGHFAKLTTRLLKLTKTLLQKFDCGNCLTKIEMKQKNPRFDVFLNIIHKYLNKTKFQILIETLQLQEVRGTGQQNIRQAFISNTFLAQLIQGQGDASSNYREKILVNTMLSQSIECLNQILRLALQNDLHSSFNSQNNKQALAGQNFMDSRGVKLYYASKLQCTHELKQQILDPSQTNLTLKCNLINLLAFYAKIEYTQSDAEANTQLFELNVNKQITIENNILASEFVKNCCLLWQAQTQGHRVDLSLVLVKNGFLLTEDIKKVFLIPLIVSMSELRRLRQVSGDSIIKLKSALMRYLIQQVENLTICANSQHGFMEHLFNDPLALKEMKFEFTQYFAGSRALTEIYPNEELRHLAKTLGQKLVGLFSEMSEQRVGLTFLKQLTGVGSSDSSFLKNLQATLIEPICEKEGPKVEALNLNLQNPFSFHPESAFDFYAQEMKNTQGSVEYNNQIIIQQVYNHSCSVFTLSQFLRLLQNLYSFDPNYNMPLRLLIQEVFTANDFFNIKSSESLKKDLNWVAQNLKEVNTRFRLLPESQDETEFFSNLRDYNFFLTLQKVVERENLLSQEQAEATQFNHELVSVAEKNKENKDDKGPPIYLANTDTFKTHQGLKFLERICSGNMPVILTSTHSSSDIFKTCGNVGAEFLIDTRELKQTLLMNGYVNIDAVNEFVNFSRQFNLCMSALVAQNVLNQAKSDFVMSVGRTKLYENVKSLPSILGDDGQKGSSHSFQMLASLFPLVDKDFPKQQRSALNLKEVKSSVNQLLQHNLTICKTIFGQLLKEYNTAKEQGFQGQLLYLGFKNSQIMLENLENALSSINLCVSQSSIGQVCKVEELQCSKAVFEFVSNDLLLHFAEVFNYHMNHIASQGSESIQSASEMFLRHKELTYSALSIQLMVAQIMESITFNQQFDRKTMPSQTDGIISQLTQIVQIMNKLGEAKNIVGQSTSNTDNKQMFRDCLRIFQVSINLLSQETIHNFMHQGINQPLRVIIQRFIETTAADVDDAIEILQFLTTYAESASGSQHLMRENILQYLSMSQTINNAKFKDLYESGERNEGVRNPYHMLWCHVLLLIRTLNLNLLDDSLDILADQEVDSLTYLKKLITFMQAHGFSERIQTFLCYQLNNPDGQVTQAYLEEVEIIMSIVCQIFMQADKVAKINYHFLQGLKDCMLFGLTQLFTSQRPQLGAQNLHVASSSEKFLSGLTAYYLLEKTQEQSTPASSSFSLFDLKAQVQLIKIYLSFSASLLNLMLQHKQVTGHDLLSTDKQALFPINWDYLNSVVLETQKTQSQYLFTEFAKQLKHESDQGGYGSLLKLALEQVIDSHDTLNMIYRQWRAPTLNQTKILFDHMRNVVSNDEHITKEYYGMNALFVSSNVNQESQKQKPVAQIDSGDLPEIDGAFKEFIELFESALEMGSTVQKVMLELVIACKEEGKMHSIGQHIGVNQTEVYKLAQAVFYDKSPIL